MITPVRFAYTGTAASRAEGNLLAYLPITLRHETHVLTVEGLLDTGSTVNMLPYPLGLQLGFVWDQQTTRVYLDRESCETASAGRDRLRPSSLVSAGGSGVRLDASVRRAHDPRPSELFHGI